MFKDNIMNLIKSLVLSLATISFISCSNNQPSTNEQDNVSVQLPTSEPDSLNSLPIFPDDGSLDSIYRAQNILYGPQIVRDAKDGNSDAQFALAQMYSYGICGANPNRKKAFRLYIELADVGDPRSQLMAGYMMFYGLGTTEDNEQGLQLMAAAANNDYWLAFLFMGNVYYNSFEKTEENLNFARGCYETAAAHGISAAQDMLDIINKGE